MKKGSLLGNRLDKYSDTEKFVVTIEEPVVEEETLVSESEGREKKRQQDKSRRRVFAITAKVGLILLCCNMIFLLFGLLQTNFVYDTNGKIRPTVYSLGELKDKYIFEQIMVSYVRCRNLYENIIAVDYRLSSDPDAGKLYSIEYESALEDVTILSTELEAADIDIRYNQIKSMMLSWVRDDIAVYLQNMSVALMQGNEEKYENAQIDKGRSYQNFAILTESMIALGETVMSDDRSTLYEWSPEKYILETLEGIIVE